MVKFAVRPEINGAVDGDYEKLHEEMYKLGLYRVVLIAPISGGKLRWHDLPSGLYIGGSDENIGVFAEKVRVSIERIANTYKPNKGHELFITNYTEALAHLKLNEDIKKLPPGANPNTNSM